MKVRSVILCFASLLAVPLCGAQQTDAAPSYTGQVSAPLSVTQKTEVPGASLQPGSYTIRVADSLQDRVIVEVTSENGGKHPAATFLGYPSPSMDAAGTNGPVPFNSPLKSKPALRGFLFPDGTKIEFVYPKADAVALAKANSVRVMAVDPASEGKVNLPHLSQQDLQEVTLWLLTPTPVGPAGSKPGIAAAKYQPPATPAQPSTTVAQNSTVSQPDSSAQPATSTAGNASAAQPDTTAQPSLASVSQPPTPSPAATTVAPAAPAPPAQTASNDQPQYPVGSSQLAPTRSSSAAPVQTASNTEPNLGRRPKQLPHTASNEPALWLTAFGSLAVAGTLGLRRRRTLARQRG